VRRDALEGSEQMEETEKKQLTIPRAQQIGYTSPTE
jgi:hypothetical protein